MSRNTGPTAKVRAQVAYRDQGRCLRCHAWGESIHHRIGRGAGGTSRTDVNGPAALVTLCGSGTTGCHGWITNHPTEAYATGWAIRRSSRELPSEIPMVDLFGRELFATEEGGLIYVNDVAGPFLAYPAAFTRPF